MSGFTSLGIVFLAMVIMAMMQLPSGVFGLLSHYAYGKHAKNRASMIQLAFILGVEIVSFLLFLAAYYIIYVFFLNQLTPENSILSFIAAGIFFALGIVSVSFYFRRGKGTQLFIPRRFASAFNRYAKSVKSYSDALILGIFSGVAELIFTLPLYLIVAFEMAKSEQGANPVLILLFILAAVLPLFIIKRKFRTGGNLADLMRAREQNKLFTRIILGICYMMIAILILCLRIG